MKKSIFSVCSALVFLLGGLLFSACSAAPVSTVADSPGDTVLKEDSTLFVKNSGTGVVVFETNDSRYAGEYGYTLWTEEDPVYRPFTHLGVTLSKLSGNGDAGYGVVFCSSDTGMLIILINVNREYLIGELDGNIFRAIQEWRETEDLYGGYNCGNSIDLSFDSGSGEFSLRFNGGDPVIFRDDEEPCRTEGRSGYMVVVSPRDDFPDVPVSVTFTEK